MTSEFNLSDWVLTIPDGKVYAETYVKEFIKRLKEEIAYEMIDTDEKISNETKSVLRVLSFKIDTLAGEKLI